MPRLWRWNLTSLCCPPHFLTSPRTPTTNTTAQRRPSTALAVPCRSPRQTSAIRRGPTCRRSRPGGTRRGHRPAAPWWRARQAALPFLHLPFRLIFNDKSILSSFLFPSRIEIKIVPTSRLSSYLQKFVLLCVQLSTKNRLYQHHGHPDHHHQSQHHEHQASGVDWRSLAVGLRLGRHLDFYRHRPSPTDCLLR